MYRLVISDDEGKTTIVPLVRDEITIGRKKGNTVRLTERNVSRRHARLRRSVSGFVVEDLGSYNGVKVNGKKVQGQAPVQAGDQLTIGDYKISLQLQSAANEDATLRTSLQPPVVARAPASSRSSRPPAAAPIETEVESLPTRRIPPPRLVMLSQPAPGAEFAIARPLARIGRSEALEIWVNHRSISREHAQVLEESGTLKIVDRGSANGTRVNGREVREALLRPGDLVELGQVRFRFVAEGETYSFESDETMALSTRRLHLRPALIAAVAAFVVALAVLVPLLGAWFGGWRVRDRLPPPLASAFSWFRDHSRPAARVPFQSSTTPESKSVDDAELLPRLRRAAEDCDEAMRHGFLERAAEAGRRAAAIPGFKTSSWRQRAAQCASAAEIAISELRTYERGKEALEGRDIDAAYFAFEALPEESEFRNRPEVGQATERFVAHHMRESRRLLAKDPDEAARHASLILAMENPPAEASREAKRVQKIVLRKVRPSSAAESANESEESSNKGETRSAEEPGERRSATELSPALRGTLKQLSKESPACSPMAPDYSQCVVRSLEPRSASLTPNELALLIESHRELKNTEKASRHMQDFLRRFPSHRLAAHYREFLGQAAP